MRDDEVFGGLGDDARDVLVALVSCGGYVGAADLATTATAWAAACGHALDAAAFDAAVQALDGSFCTAVPNDPVVLLGPADPAAVEQWLAERPPVLRVLVESAVFFDQIRWAARLAREGDGEALRPVLFAAARRTWDTRAVGWRPRPANARKGAPPYFPPQREPMARLGLVAALLDRDDAEATEWVKGLLPRTRQEWADHGRDAVVAALPDLAGLLADGAAALVAQALVGDERHGFGWADLAGLREDHPEVFPDDVWDDVRKRFVRWARRRSTYPLDEAARVLVATTAGSLGVDLGDDLR